MSLIYEDKTRVLHRCFFDVQNEVGLGRQEEDYHRGCKLWLRDNQIPFTSKQPHPLLLEGRVAHTLYPDLVTWDSITVELKAVMRRLRSTESVQLFDYLKYRGDRLGLLVNMGLDRVHVERIVHEPPETSLEEHWTYWADCVSGRARDLGIAVRGALRAVYREHQTGYGEEVTAKLILCALRSRSLAITIAPVSKACYRGVELHESPLECIVIENRLLLVYTALFDSNEFNLNRGKSYLKALGLDWGIAANFGKNKAEFCGLRRGK